MRFGIKTLDEAEVAGKTVLCRVDINQPVNKETGRLKSLSRVKASVPTLKELSDKGAKVVILAHQGSDIEYKNFYTTCPHAEALSELLGRPVRFIDDVCGPAAREAIKGLKDGELLMLDNVRFCSEEQTLFEQSLRLSHEAQARTEVVRKLAPLAELYVNDAFAAAHRDQPSLCAFQQVLPSVMGRLFEKEYTVISELMAQPKRPCVYVLGGAKVADAFLMMETVLKNGSADTILTGGLVANIILAAGGQHIGQGSLNYLKETGNDQYLPAAKALLEHYADRIVVPTDLAYIEQGKRHEAALSDLPFDSLALDIGSETAAHYADKIQQAATVFVNGPMGVFEEEATELGSRLIWEALGTTAAYTVIGGGDSLTATAKFGQTDKIGYLCTGGGALIRFLTGEELPVIKALRHAAKVFS